MTRAVFAIPGDLHTVTGGYLYERRLLESLRESGVDVEHLRLGGSFPDPTPSHHDDAVRALRAVDAATPIILDGFLVGCLDPEGLAAVAAPLIGVVHHPLAHEEGLDPARRAHLFRTERTNLRLLSTVLVPSPHTARMLVEEYDVPAARVRVARPGTDRPSPAPRPVERDDPPLVLSVGLLHPRKGHETLLQALARLTDLRWHAVIVGTPHDPGHLARLTALRAELGLAHRVRLAGGAPADERDELYRRAGVFALATRYEGYGLVFDEALVHGLPIVSCRTGAVPDTVPADAGVLVPPGDPVAFAAALRAVLSDADRRDRMARAAACAGVALPNWSDTAAVAEDAIEAARTARGLENGRSTAAERPR